MKKPLKDRKWVSFINSKRTAQIKVRGEGTGPLPIQMISTTPVEE